MELKFRFDHYRDLSEDELDKFIAEARQLEQIGLYQVGSTEVDGSIGDIFDSTDLTVCRALEDQDGTLVEIARGYAFCSPFDQFQKRIGRQISQHRANEAATFVKRIDNALHQSG